MSFVCWVWFIFNGLMGLLLFHSLSQWAQPCAPNLHVRFILVSIKCSIDLSQRNVIQRRDWTRHRVGFFIYIPSMVICENKSFSALLSFRQVLTRVREIAAAMDNRSVNNRSVTLKYWTPSCPNLPHPFFVGRVGRWMTFQPMKRMGKGSLDLSKVVAEKGV